MPVVNLKALAAVLINVVQATNRTQEKNKGGR